MQHFLHPLWTAAWLKHCQVLMTDFGPAGQRSAWHIFTPRSEPLKVVGHLSSQIADGRGSNKIKSERSSRQTQRRLLNVTPAWHSLQHSRLVLDRRHRAALDRSLCGGAGAALRKAGRGRPAAELGSCLGSGSRLRSPVSLLLRLQLHPGCQRALPGPLHSFRMSINAKQG